jgi:hypothetical protein
MTWKRVGGKEYLYRIVNQYIQKSLGPRSPETERLSAFPAQLVAEWKSLVSAPR